MPKTTLAANARTMLTDRRSFLQFMTAAGAALAPASAFAAVSSFSTPDEIASAPLADLIAQHKDAYAAFSDICGFEDRVNKSDPCYPSMEKKRRALSEAEAEALDALCAFRPETMAEVRERGDYLANFLLQNELSPEQEEELLRSYAA